MPEFDKDSFFLFLTAIGILCLLMSIILSFQYLLTPRCSNNLKLQVREGFEAKRQPIQPPKRTVTMYQGPVRRDDSIFVSIASYRDDECLQTVRDMYTKARFPSKVFVGLVQQNKEASEDCQSMEYGQNIRAMTLTHDEARGPCYARYLCSSLWRGETFFFQIDSHTRFEKDWDSTLIEMWRDMKDPKTVFAHYPKDYEDKDKDSVPVNCMGEYQENGIIRMAALNMGGFNRPRATYWGGANFLFGHGQMILDVPFDPELDMLFHGEELLYSARLFTHGYTIYAPHKNTVFHWYGRENKPKFWDDVVDRKSYEKQQLESEQKVKDILGMKGAQRQYSLGVPYGLGTLRPMKEFWDLTGVNFDDLSKNPHVNTCNRFSK